MRHFPQPSHVNLEGYHRQIRHSQNRQIRWSRIATLLALFLVLELAHSVAAQTTLVIDQPLNFKYVGSDQRQFTFRVSSSKGDIPDTTIILRSLKDPTGQSLPATALTLCVDNKDCGANKPVTITEAGSEVVLTLQPASFVGAGEYHAFIDITPPAASPVTKASATVTITRPAAEINFDDVKDQTIEVFRWTPWSSGAEDFDLYLLTTNKVAIDEVKASGQGVFVTKTKTRVPGDLTVTAAQAAQSNPGSPASGAPDPAVIRLNVKARNLDRAGSFDTSVVVDSPGLAERKIIPLHINVSDIVIWPLLVISAGVFAAFIVSQLSGKWRTRQLNRRTILRLEGELSNFRRVVKSPENAARVDAMWRSLRTVEEANELDDPAKVTADLGKIETELNEFRKTFAEAKAKSQTDLGNLRHDIDLFAEQFKDLTVDDERNLHALNDRLDDAKRLLENDQVDYATEKIASIGVLFSDLRKSLLNRYFEKLQKLYHSEKTSSGKTDPDSEALITEIKTLLATGKLDEAGKQLEQLKLTIEQFTDANKALSARAAAPTEIEAPPIHRFVERTRITITTPPSNRTTDNTINFEIVDAENLFQAGDVFRWNFGEPGSQEETTDKQKSYKYREAENYNVTVDVLRANKLIKSLSEPLTILPGAKAVESRNILGNIKTGDLILSLVAVVLASLTGLLALYIGHTFGTISDYVVAFLWGFGIDSSVKGFAAVLAKLGSSGGAG